MANEVNRDKTKVAELLEQSRALKDQFDAIDAKGKDAIKSGDTGRIADAIEGEDAVLTEHEALMDEMIAIFKGER